MEMEKQVLKLQEEISEHAAAKLANGTITVTDYITELNKERISRINLANAPGAAFTIHSQLFDPSRKPVKHLL